MQNVQGYIRCSFSYQGLRPDRIHVGGRSGSFSILSTESILIVGATGAVGSELVRQFAATGRRVKALVRDERKAASIAHLAAPVIGDLAAPASLKPAFKGAERVAHLANERRLASLDVDWTITI